MKINKSKRGFTLTELAIVIAVIAILIAILVPTFVSLINKANNSSDEQTVKNLNTALSIDEAENDRPEYLCQVWDILKEAGYNPAPTPNYSDNEFYWYKSVNRVVIVSVSQSEILFPSEYAGITVTDDTSASISLRLTAAKAAAESINKSALVSLSVDEDDPSAHCYDAGTVTKESTCTEDGEIVYYCSACDGTKTEVIEAAGHSYDDGETTDYVTAEGVVYTGGTKKTCSVCGDVELSGGTVDTSTYTYKVDGDDVILTAWIIDNDTYYQYEKTGISIEVPYGTTKIADGTDADSGVFSPNNYDFSLNITSLTLPETLTYIGDYAFYEQNDFLTSVYIPASITYIGDYAFFTCSSLTSVTFENDSQLNSIGYQAFYMCNQLTSFTIPASVTSIGQYAFQKCSFSSVTFENTSGWYVTTTLGASSGTDISSENLSNVSTAAYYLITTGNTAEGQYCGYYWYRSE